jgi:hypothetical protein
MQNVRAESDSMIPSFEDGFFSKEIITNLDKRRDSHDTSKFNGSAHKISSLTSCLTPNFKKYRIN